MERTPTVSLLFMCPQTQARGKAIGKGTSAGREGNRGPRVGGERSAFSSFTVSKSCFLHPTCKVTSPQLLAHFLCPAPCQGEIAQQCLQAYALLRRCQMSSESPSTLKTSILTGERMPLFLGPHMLFLGIQKNSTREPDSLEMGKATLLCPNEDQTPSPEPQNQTYRFVKV